MSTTNERYFGITDGPNRNDFVNSFLYANDGDIWKRLCNLTLEDSHQQKQKIVAKLIEVSHEDGSGHSYMFKCYFGTKTDKNPMHRAVGYYNASTRKGWLKSYD